MRFAGDRLNVRSEDGVKTYIGDPGTRNDLDLYRMLQQKPVVPGFNAEDLEVTPEITPTRNTGPGQDLMLDQYIRSSPRSGVALLPGGEHGPAQGPNIPIKNYGGKYMPDATQPTGYRPTPGGLV